MFFWLSLINSFVFAVSYNESHAAVISTNIDIFPSNGTETPSPISSFRTLLYTPPSITALSSLTGRGLQPRLLYHCRSPTATFHHSHCMHRPGQPGGMQRYIIYCREDHPVDTGRLHTPLPFGESGVCSTKEICVDSWVGDPYTGISLARCVPQDAFESLDSIDDDTDDRTGQGRSQGQDNGPTKIDTDDDSEEDNSGHIGGEKRRKLERGFVLGGNQASVVISHADASTPMGINKMELNVIGNEFSTSMCQNCFEIRAKRLAPNTTELNMQATLVSAGTVAAGVMWVALFSG